MTMKLKRAKRIKNRRDNLLAVEKKAQEEWQELLRKEASAISDLADGGCLIKRRENRIAEADEEISSLESRIAVLEGEIMVIKGSMSEATEFLASLPSLQAENEDEYDRAKRKRASIEAIADYKEALEKIALIEQRRKAGKERKENGRSAKVAEDDSHLEAMGRRRLDRGVDTGRAPYHIQMAKRKR